MKFSLVSDWLTDFLHHQFKQFSNRSGYALGLGGLALFCMSLLSWKLLGAIALGLAVAWGVYEMQQPNLPWMQRGQRTFEQLWSKPLGKSAISGSSITILSVLGFGIANSTGRGWIAATLLLQSVMAVGLWAIWQELKRHPQQRQTSTMPLPNLDRYINDLAHPSLMRRMIAVRRLHHVVLTRSISAAERHELRDYFQILLTQETDSLIRLALQDALDTFYQKDNAPRAIQSSSLETVTTVQVRNASPRQTQVSLSAIKL